MRKRKGTAALAVLAAAGLLAGCGGKDADTVTVGSKGFTENLIVSELYALALEDQGLKVDRKFELYSSVIHDTLTKGEIDLYPEYTGTAWLTILGNEMETDPQAIYEGIREQYEEKYGLKVLELCAVNDGNGLAMRAEAAEQYGIRTISDLQKQASGIRFGSTADFAEREDGLPQMEAVYGPFDFKESTSFDNALKYDIMEAGEVDCVPAYTTDARLAEEAFILLEDDKQMWPPYNLIPVARGELLEQHPEAEEAINRISAALDTETMTELNYQVDIEKREYDEVAQEFYESIADRAQ